MKKIFLCFRYYGFLVATLLLVLGACDRYPANPSVAEGQSAAVVIRLVATDYLSIQSTEDGLVANRVNVLTFEIESRISAKALEFCGRVQIEGPPQSQQHVLHFRTDEVNSAVQISGAVFNVVESLRPGDVIRLVRPKYPMNEYAPFTGSQGMIRSVLITEIWAIDDQGNRTRISFLMPVS